MTWGRSGWLSASVSCEAMGAHLATLTTEAERAFVAPLIYQSILVGASSADGVTFTWVTGEPFAFAAWDLNEPNGVGPGCLAVQANQAWVDADCAAAFPALCERDE